MRPFRYRIPRFLVSAQLYFRVGQNATPAVCTDISSGGLKALFDGEAPDVGTYGVLVLRYPEREFSLGALVTHLEGKEVGFSFVQRDLAELATAEQFADFLESQPSNDGLSPV